MIAIEKSGPSRVKAFLLVFLGMFGMLLLAFAGAALLHLTGEGTILGVLLGLSIFFGNAVFLVLMAPDPSSRERRLWGVAFMRGIPVSAVSLLLLSAASRAYLAPRGYWDEEDMFKGLIILIALAIGGQVVRRHIGKQA